MNVGDKVQWTHIRQNGRSMVMSAMEGKILSIDGDLAKVKQTKSGRTYEVKVSRLRSMDQVNELTELVMRKR